MLLLREPLSDLCIFTGIPNDDVLARGNFLCSGYIAAGVNDQREHAEELATLLHQWNLGRHVNIIPYNPIADSEFERPTKAKVSIILFKTDQVYRPSNHTATIDASLCCIAYPGS